MRMTEAQIRRIIKEELLIVLEVQDPTVKYSYLGLGKKSPNIATNPEVRTKPQSGNIPNIAKKEFSIDASSPITSYETLIRNDPNFRNLFIQAVDQKTGFVNTKQIANYLRGLVKNDADMDKMLSSLNKENVEDLVEYTQEFEVVRENKRK